MQPGAVLDPFEPLADSQCAHDVEVRSIVQLLDVEPAPLTVLALALASGHC